MKTIFVGLFLTINAIAYSQATNHENPLNNSRNYKTGPKTAEGKTVKTVKQSIFKKNYKKSAIEKPDTQETNNLVDSPEKSMENRNYKRK